MEEREKISDRYPIIKIGLVPVPEEEKSENESSGLSPDAVRLIAGGPAAVRPRVQNVLKNPSSPVNKPPQNPNSQKR